MNTNGYDTHLSLGKDAFLLCVFLSTPHSTRYCPSWHVPEPSKLALDGIPLTDVSYPWDQRLGENSEVVQDRGEIIRTSL